MDLGQRLSDLIDDPDFKAVDRRMGRFNLFEAVGAVSGELRHSNFLAFLLSPSRNHGLGSELLLRFLRTILAGMPADKRPIRALELIVGDLDGAVVHREWNNIDLLIEIKQVGLVIVVENKVDAKASGDSWPATGGRRWPTRSAMPTTVSSSNVSSQATWSKVS